MKAKTLTMIHLFQEWQWWWKHFSQQATLYTTSQALSWEVPVAQDALLQLHSQQRGYNIFQNTSNTYKYMFNMAGVGISSYFPYLIFQHTTGSCLIPISHIQAQQLTIWRYSAKQIFTISFQHLLLCMSRNLCM